MIHADDDYSPRQSRQTNQISREKASQNSLNWQHKTNISTGFVSIFFSEIHADEANKKSTQSTRCHSNLIGNS